MPSVVIRDERSLSFWEIRNNPTPSLLFIRHTGLKYNNTTPFLLNNYLLKCAQHILDVFSTENLPIHRKILIGLKDQFDLHKLL